MATKRYRKPNKNSKITYEDIKDLDFNSLSDEELEKYGLGSWLKKNASWLAPVAGIGAGIATGGLLLGPGLAAGATAGAATGAAAGGFSAAGAAMGAGIGSSLGSSVGGAVTNNYNQDQAIAAQNAQNKQTNAYTQAQNQLQMLQGNTPQETMGTVRRCGGKLRRMAKGGSVKHYLTTSSGEQEISPDEVENVKKYLVYQKRLNDYYSGKYKTRIGNLKKLGITTPEAYEAHIAKNPKDILEPEDYAALYKGSKFTPEEIAEYEPLRDKYFSVGQVKGTKEGDKIRVTDTAFAGRNFFAGLNLGFKQIPEEVPPQQVNTSPYSYEPYRGYSGISIGYSMDKPGGTRTPSVFRSSTGQEVAIDPKRGMVPTAYPELTREFQNIPQKQYGGTINYNGQYHEGPDGGVPVDNSGNYNPVNPVAMVEKGEVSYTGEDGNPYIFSDTLQLSKDKTFAKEAKGVQSKYRLRMKNGKVTDPISRKGYDLDMEGLKSKQEELRDAMELMEEDKMAKNREYGGNLPEYDGLSTNSMYLPKENNTPDFSINTRMLPFDQYSFGYNKIPNTFKGANGSAATTSTTEAGWTPYSGAGWESAIGLAAPIAGNIINMIGANRRRGKGRISVPESGPSPTPISLERERASARELGNVASANTRRALKGGTSAQQYMANVGAAEAGIQRNLGNQLGESYQREELMNSNLSQEERARQDRLKEMGMQADMYNSQLGMIEDAQQSQYINNMINAVNQWGSDMSKSKQNAMYMQMLNPNVRIQQRPRYRSWAGRNFGPKDTRVWEDLND
jgi:hypothetical protein